MAEKRWFELGDVEELKQPPLRQVTIGRTRIALSCRTAVRRRLRRLQSRRRAARRGDAGRRLRGLPLAPLAVPPRDRRGGARLRGGPGAALRAARGGRAALRRPRAGDPPQQAAACAAPARPAGRAGTGAGAGAGDLDDGHGPGVSALLDLGRAARQGAGGRRRARRRDPERPPARLEVPRLRGLLLEGRPRLHLALLDHPDGPEDQMDAVYEGIVHWADVVLVATPIRWGSASSLYYRMVERMNCVQNQVTIRNRVLMRNKVAASSSPAGRTTCRRWPGSCSASSPSSAACSRSSPTSPTPAAGRRRTWRATSPSCSRAGAPRRGARARRPRHRHGEDPAPRRPRRRGATGRARRPQGVPADDARVSGQGGGGDRSGRRRAPRRLSNRSRLPAGHTGLSA